MSDRIQTGIRFEESMLRKLSYIAKQNRRSLNAQLEFLAQKSIADYEKKNGPIALEAEE